MCIRDRRNPMIHQERQYAVVIFLIIQIVFVRNRQVVKATMRLLHLVYVNQTTLRLEEADKEAIANSLRY